MSFTAKELEQEISDIWEKTHPDADYGQNFFLQAYYEDVDGVLPNTKYGKVEHVSSWGGEGDGAQIHVVIKVADRYFEMDGYYSSWGEDSMDGELYEVKPVEVMRTEYQSI